MRGRILFVLLIQVAQVESLEVNGYLGDSVTLPSGGNPSWELSTIKWSIFTNDSFIATYHNGHKNTDHFSRYKGRLDLNTSSGDLTIHNLTRDDDMEYTVDLIDTERRSITNKIKLTVLKHLQKPTINTISSKSTEGGCWIRLCCTSADEGVDFSWEVEPDSVPHATNRDGVLSAVLNRPQTKITCISSKNNEKALNSVTPKCDEHLQKPTINTISSKSTEEGCWIWLRCTSPEEGVDFSWEVEPDSVLYTTNRDGVLSAVLNRPQTKITCISSKNNERASSSVSPKCDDGNTQQGVCLHGFIVAVAALIMLIPITIWKGGKGSSNRISATGGPAELNVVDTSGAEQELLGGEGSSNRISATGGPAELKVVDTSGTEQELLGTT